MGIRNLDYFTFRKYSRTAIPPVCFEDQFYQEFKNYRPVYERLFEQLQDDESKQILQAIMNFRLHQNLNYMKGFDDCQHRQYFEDFLNLQKSGETFVDIGGFDGFTSREFARRCPRYNSIHLFEPEKTNMEGAKRNLANQENTYFYEVGLSNTNKTLKFSSTGSSSKVSSDGDIEINVIRLDELPLKDVTFLKMDIEGSELDALRGAKDLIASLKPRLAISVYHRSEDLRTISEYILMLNPSYKCYLRHYTEGVTETVLFFVP